MATLSKETKYIIADAIANSFSIPAEAITDSTRNYYFREVINAPISINGVQTTLAGKFEEEDAKHITSLVLRRLSTPTLRRRAVNITM